jgi:mRNA-degrading endonuclease toxin of MazEF toxin-antitoxin module
MIQKKIFMNYKRGDVVILSFPFVTPDGTMQKARPALVISDHSIRRRFDDLILVGITSRRLDDVTETEFLIKESADYFEQSGLKKSSVVRCEYLMTVPKSLVTRKLGQLPNDIMKSIDKRIMKSLGLESRKSKQEKTNSEKKIEDLPDKNKG